MTTNNATRTENERNKELEEKERLEARAWDNLHMTIIHSDEEKEMLEEAEIDQFGFANDPKTHYRDRLREQEETA